MGWPPAPASWPVTHAMQRRRWWDAALVVVVCSVLLDTNGAARQRGRTPMGMDHRVVLPDGRVVSYADTGARDRTVVLYLHGTPGSRMQAGGPVSDTAAALGIRLFAPDRPGYGHASFVPYRAGEPARRARHLEPGGSAPLHHRQNSTVAASGATGQHRPPLPAAPRPDAGHVPGPVSRR